jgi:hypothetical protein
MPKFESKVMLIDPLPIALLRLLIACRACWCFAFLQSRLKSEQIEGKFTKFCANLLVTLALFRSRVHYFVFRGTTA